MGSIICHSPSRWKRNPVPIGTLIGAKDGLDNVAKKKYIALTGIRTPYLPAPGLVINHKSAREEVELLGEASSHLMFGSH